MDEQLCIDAERLFTAVGHKFDNNPILPVLFQDVIAASDRSNGHKFGAGFFSSEKSHAYWFHGFQFICQKDGLIGYLCLFNSNFPFAPAGGANNEYKGKLPHGLTWDMTRADVHGTCSKPSSEDQVMNSEWYGSGMVVIYDKVPADTKLQRIQCILLPQDWPKTVGASASQQKGLLTHKVSEEEQQKRNEADIERAKQKAESLRREREQHSLTQRAQTLELSLLRSISQKEGNLQPQFAELLQLNPSGAFSLLFPLAGAGCVDQINLLLDRNADACCDTLDKDGRNALHEAASSNAVAVARALIQRCPPKLKFNFLNLKCSGHLTPLHEAVRQGHNDVVQALLELGADDSIKNSKGHRAFDLAVKSHHVQIVQCLLTQGNFCSGVVPYQWDYKNFKSLQREAKDDQGKQRLSEILKLVLDRDRSIKVQLEQETFADFVKRRKEAFDMWCKSQDQEDLLQHMSSRHWGRAMIADVNEHEAKDLQRLHARVILDVDEMVDQSCFITVRSTAGVFSGMKVFGNGIPSDTIVQKVMSPTQVELSNTCILSANSKVVGLSDYNILEPSVFDVLPPPMHAELFKAVAYSLCSVSSRMDVERCIKAYAHSVPARDKSALFLLAHARLCSSENVENQALFVELLFRFEDFCRANDVDVDLWVTPAESAELQKWKQPEPNTLTPRSSDNTFSFTPPQDEEEDHDHSANFERFMESQDFKALSPDQRLPMIQLQMLSGLSDVKKIACQLYEEMTFEKSSAEKKAENRNRALNYAFVGSPGTGKTTVARIFCQILVKSGARTGEQFLSMSAQEAMQLGPVSFATELKKMCGKAKDERGVPDYWRKGLQVEVLEFVPEGISGVTATNKKKMWEPIMLALDVERVVNGTFTVAHAKSLLSFLPVGLPVTLDPQAKIDLDKSLTYYIKKVTADQIELAHDIKLSKPVVPPDSSVPFAILYEHFIDKVSILKTGNASDVSIFTTSNEFAHSQTGLVSGSVIEFVEDVQASMPPHIAALKNTPYIVGILSDKQFTIASVLPADESKPHDGLIAGQRVCGVSHNLPKLPRMLVRKAITPKWHAAKIASYTKGNETCSVTYADGTSEDAVNMSRLRLSGLFGKPGGVLFLDEAYDLNPSTNESGRAIFNSIMQAAEEYRDRVTIILAGYKKDIESKLYAYNPGMASRIRSVEFPDFSVEELGEIWKGLCEKELFLTSPQVTNIATRRVARGIGKHGFANARTVRNVFELALSAAKMRIKHTKSSERSSVNEILVEDVIGKDPSRNPEVEALFKEVNLLVGQAAVKERFQQFLQVAKSNYAKELRAAEGVEAVGVDDMQLNRMFLGSPGTGKTTFAGLYARLLKCLGFLSNGEYLKKDATDFVADAVGGTQNKAAALLESAKGKVLLIDEAYTLNDNEYGREAINTLVGRVQGVPGEDIAVVLCGYTDRMLKMLQEANPGLSSRFDVGSAFEFSDFSDKEMLQIFSTLCSKKRPPVYAPIEVKIAAVKSLAMKRCLPNFGNARSVDVVLTNAIGQMTARERKSGASERHLALSDIETSTVDNVQKLLAELSEYGGEFQQLINQLGSRIILHRQEGRQTTVDHYVFTGNPGTGKTWAARTIANLLHEFGVVASSTFIETSASDLLGQYVGHTKDNVDKAVQSAQGGVLFIDEAYELGKSRFGEEGLTQLVGMLTRPEFMHGKTVVILAGYQRAMEEMFARNVGLKSRFKKYLNFSDWPTERCIGLISKQLMAIRPRPFLLEDTAKTHLEHMLDELRNLPFWGNGRDADTLCKMLVEHRDNRRCAENEAGVAVRRDVEFLILPQDVESAKNEFFASRKQVPAVAPVQSKASSSGSISAVQLPNDFCISVFASLHPQSNRLIVRDVLFDEKAAPPPPSPDSAGNAPDAAATATKTKSIEIMRHRGGGGEAVVSSGNFDAAADRELDPYKLKQLSDRIAQIGAIRSSERGAEQQKHKEIHRIQQLIKSLEAMDVEEAEDILDQELERQKVMERIAAIGRCVMNFAWRYELGFENGRAYHFRCCGGSHTVSFEELGIPHDQQPYMRDLFRHSNAE